MKMLIVANWKMNPQTLQETKRIFNSVKKGIKSASQLIKEEEVVICPPFVYLFNVQRQKSNIRLGAQDVFWENEGAYTGEISPFMLKDTGCEYVIIGHSERRRYFKETDEMVNKKVKAAFKAGLNPILCVGETKKEKDEGKTKNVLKRQLTSAFRKITISSQQSANFVIAYEPVWAIGSGQSCEVKEVKKINLLIRKVISEIYNFKIGEKVRLLYGGSVNSKNAELYIKKAELDGLLIGGASLKAKEFVKIIRTVA